MLKRYLQRFPHAGRGLWYALRHDFGFRTQIYVGLLVGTGITYWFTPLTLDELLWLALAAILILITELQNSALEVALDRLHPERHLEIKRSKDMAAAAVLLAGLFAGLVVGVLLVARLGI